MTQDERLDFLIEAFKAEFKEYKKHPAPGLATKPAVFASSHECPHARSHEYRSIGCPRCVFA